MIQFSADRANRPDPPCEEYEDEFEELDIWCEQHVELMEKEDYPALVEHCRRHATKYPDDPYAQIFLGQACILNREYQKTIDLLTPYHRRDPVNMDYHHVILDALFAMGKTEDDFEWTENPEILRMSDSILDSCFNFLKPKRKPRTVSELYIEFIPKGYLLFCEDDLLGALLRDKRFAVTNAHEGPFAKVQVVRKGRKMQRM